MMAQPYDAFLKRVLESAQVYSNLPSDGKIESEQELAIPEAPQAQPQSSNRKQKEKKKRKNHFPTFSPPSVQTMATLLTSLERAVARGSAFFNAGQADLCARLYFQTVGQVAQVLSAMGEKNAAAYFGDVLARASTIEDASSAAWFLRDGIERLVAAVRNAPEYASLFKAVSSEAYDTTCAYGLVVQRVGDELRVYELRCATQCDNDLDAHDAIFFVELDDSSSESDEFDIEIEIDVEGDDSEDSELGDGVNDDVDVPQRDVAYGNDDVSTKTVPKAAHSRSLDRSSLLMRCAVSTLIFLTMVLLLMAAWRRRQQRLRMRAAAAAQEQQNKQRIQRVFGQHGFGGGKAAAAQVVPMNTPYAAFV